MKKNNVDEKEANFNEVLDKLLELKQNNNEPGFGKKALYVFGVISGSILIGFLCLTLYKNAFSVESILSLLLAFFSIFISVFFYFKAADTSNDFYKSSYDFMKEVSVTLGKIEERFGAQLNSINEKIAFVSAEQEVKTDKLDSVSDEYKEMISELLEKSQLDNEAKEIYKRQLENKNAEMENLQNEIRMLSRAQREYERKVMNLNEMDNIRIKYSNDERLIENNIMKIIESLPKEYRMMLAKGENNEELKILFERNGINIDNISKKRIHNILSHGKYEY